MLPSLLLLFPLLLFPLLLLLLLHLLSFSSRSTTILSRQWVLSLELRLPYLQRKQLYQVMALQLNPKLQKVQHRRFSLLSLCMYIMLHILCLFKTQNGFNSSRVSGGKSQTSRDNALPSNSFSRRCILIYEQRKWHNNTLPPHSSRASHPESRTSSQPKLHIYITKSNMVPRLLSKRILHSTHHTRRPSNHRRSPSKSNRQRHARSTRPLPPHPNRRLERRRIRRPRKRRLHLRSALERRSSIHALPHRLTYHQRECHSF